MDSKLQKFRIRIIPDGGGVMPPILRHELQVDRIAMSKNPHIYVLFAIDSVIIRDKICK